VGCNESVDGNPLWGQGAKHDLQPQRGERKTNRLYNDHHIQYYALPKIQQVLPNPTTSVIASAARQSS